nr:MAG TPA: hypothetical protein [Caudoviricetes sp.]
MLKHRLRLSSADDGRAVGFQWPAAFSLPRLPWIFPLPKFRC